MSEAGMAKAYGFLAASFSVAVACATPAWCQAPTNGCPAPDASAQIEVLPLAKPLTGNTCNATRNTVEIYRGGPDCRILLDKYPKPEAIYKVWLHPGNKVRFSLAFPRPVDLALALIRDCGVGTSCISARDAIRSVTEELPEQSYPPGFYYLYVDAATGGVCGAYALEVAGVNPTPDLALELVRSPQFVRAGDTLEYTLAVSNKGALDATGVEITQTLPVDLTLVSGCGGQGRDVLCTIGKLPIGGRETRTIKVRVASGARNSVSSTAEVTANEGDPSSLNNKATVKTTVKTLIDLAIEEHSPSLNSVIAGKSKLIYTFRVKNYGPSDATQVKVTYHLPADVRFEKLVKAPQGCKRLDECTIPRITPGTSVGISLLVNVEPSARKSLVNTVQVSAIEPEPGPGPDPRPNISALTVGVIRITDLSLAKEAPAEVIAGTDLEYVITLKNAGPSDSAGGSITDDLPDKMKVVFPPGGPCSATGRTVTCTTGPIDRNGSRSVSFKARVDPSPPPSLQLSNTASVSNVTADEQDPVADNNSNVNRPAQTSVKVEADLELVEMRAAGSVLAGENLLYTIKVMNHGPSDSRRGKIEDTLKNDLRFISSPDGCREEADRSVVCPLPDLAVGESFTARLVVAVDAGITAESIDNEASVKGLADPVGGNNSGSISTRVQRAADLSVTVTDTPDAVLVGGDLTYALNVTNSGPSDVAGATVRLTLPSGGSFVSASDLDCQKITDEDVDPVIVQCDFAPLAAGATRSREIQTLAPGERGTAKAEASVSAGTPDPNNDNDTAEAITTLATGDDPDLVVTKKAGVEAVVAGDLLRYMIEVANQGLAAASDVRVEDPLLPEEVDFIPSADGVCTLSGQVVTCGIGRLEKGEKRSVTLTVSVKSNIAAGPLRNTAYIPVDVSDAIHDPDKGNDESTVIVPVLHIPPLVLSFFEVASGVTTLFALKNPCEKVVCVHFRYLPENEEPEEACIPGKGIYSRNLRDIEALRGRSGYVGITPVDLNGCLLDVNGSPTSLSGDFIRIEPGAASGLPLVSTDTSRVPPELCRRWSVRFLNDSVSAGRTAIAFLVPGNSPDVRPVAVGKVYNESGQLVQEVAVTDSRPAFQRTVQELQLLAPFGSIEWELREGMSGNVAAFHNAAGRYAVAVPGFCRDEKLGSGSPLVLPYFEVNRPKGITTLFAVRNETEDTVGVKVKINYFSADGASLSKPLSLTLTRHDTHTVNLQDELQGQGGITGFVQIEPTGKVSGDFVWIDQSRGASGGALVDTSRQLCNQWDVRFLQGVPTDAATDFVFYIPGNNPPDEPDEPIAKGQAYGEDGQPIVAVEEDNPLSAFRIPARLTGSGSIEWRLRDQLKGYVGMIFTAPGISPVFVPGICRQP